jgi:hypothetical protein
MTIELWFQYKNEDSKRNVKDAVSRFYCSFADDSDYVAFIDDQDFIPFFLFLAQHYGVFLTKLPDSAYHSDFNCEHILEVIL